MLLCHILFLKFDPPFKKETQLRPHGMASGLGQDKMPFRQRFQLIRSHKRTLDHLQALAGVIFSSADRAGQHRFISQGLGQDLRTLRVWCKPSKQNVLTVIDDDLTALFPIILLQLGKGLDDRHHADTPGTACGEQHFQGFDLGDSSDLITEDHHTVRQLPAMLIRDGQHLPVDLL